MKDIGSIFPLTADDMSLIDKSAPSAYINGSNRINFSLCREAMYAVAKQYEDTNKKVLLPAYTCQTVIDPFVQQGWECSYYNINKNLRIDTSDLIEKVTIVQPSIIVVHPYYGMELNRAELESLKEIKDAGCILIEDLTQCIYTKIRPKFIDYFTGSYRKWFKVPDGGFVESTMTVDIEIPESENTSFVKAQSYAMYLRQKYFDTDDEVIKSISIKLNKDAVAGIGGDIICHKMSDFSVALMGTERHDISAKQRIENYNYLYRNIKLSEEIESVCKDISEITTAPLYFPIYVKNRSELQKKLAIKHIYAPILWPVHTEEVLINENIKSIYNHILMIPIDQRYDLLDMEKIVNIINNYE